MQFIHFEDIYFHDFRPYFAVLICLLHVLRLVRHTVSVESSMFAGEQCLWISRPALYPYPGIYIVHPHMSQTTFLSTNMII